jgi:hypothetical protein
MIFKRILSYFSLLCGSPFIARLAYRSLAFPELFCIMIPSAAEGGSIVNEVIRAILDRRSVRRY